MLISTAVPFCLLLKGVELLIFTTDRAYGRAAVSQGGVGKRWKNHGVFLRYSYPSGLILPLLAEFDSRIGHHVKKSKRGACEQKAATVLPNRTAAA